MRLDHLLSKENIVYFCFVTGWVLVSALLVTKFFVIARFACGGKVFRWETPRVCACVVCACGVLELIKQRLFAVFQPYWLEGFCRAMCLCSGLFCLYGMLLGV